MSYVEDPLARTAPEMATVLSANVVEGRAAVGMAKRNATISAAKGRLALRTRTAAKAALTRFHQSMSQASARESWTCVPS